DAEVVVAMPLDRSRETSQHFGLRRETVELVGGEVTPVETDLRARLEQLLDELRTQPVIHSRRRSIGSMPVPRNDVEGRAARPVRTLLRRDLGEAPVRIRAAHLVERHPRERTRVTKGAVP